MKNDEKDCTPVEQISDAKVQPDVKEALLSKRADLTRELKELDAAITGVQEEYSLRLEQLQAQKKPLEDALHHVDALLRFEGYYINNSLNASDEGTTPGVIVSASITDAVFNLLEELHHPMHYKDIAAKLQEGNTYIPGKDPAATLLSRMSRDNRFKRTGKRGIYALSTWRVRSTKSESSAPRKKQRKRR
jgi:hypothetical protein